jgi:hypothetical protein
MRSNKIHHKKLSAWVQKLSKTLPDGVDIINASEYLILGKEVMDFYEDFNQSLESAAATEKEVRFIRK